MTRIIDYRVSLFFHFSASGSTFLTRPSTADSANSRLFRHVPYRNSLLTMVLRDSLGMLSHVSVIIWCCGRRV